MKTEEERNMNQNGNAIDLDIKVKKLRKKRRYLIFVIVFICIWYFVISNHGSHNSVIYNYLYLVGSLLFFVALPVCLIVLIDVIIKSIKLYKSVKTIKKSN